MMDCAYVEPNEPQMIDIMFIKSKHIWITRFLENDWFRLENLHLRVFQLTCYILHLGEHFTVIGWAHRRSLLLEKRLGYKP